MNDNSTIFEGERLKRVFDKFAESEPSTSQGSSHSSESPETRRRKFKRRKKAVSRQLEESMAVTNMFDHIEMVGSGKPYSQLDMKLQTAPADPVIEAFSAICPPPLGDVSPKDYLFVKANTLVEMKHLKHFDRPVREYPIQYHSLIMRAANLVADKLELPELLPFPITSDLKEVPYKGAKFAGMVYAQMGMKTRAEADGVAQLDAEWAFTRLMNGHHVVPHDVRLGGRGKVTRRTEGEDAAHVPAVGRLILMLSQRDLKLCGVTEKLLTRAYAPSQYPISVGDSWFHGGTNTFFQKMRGYSEYYCFDAEKYDAWLDKWLLHISINIVRHQFIDGEKEEFDAYWNFVEESMVETTIFRDDGIRLKKFVGTTSGHSHNTLLQSICTLIVAYGAFMHLHPDLSDEEVAEAMVSLSLGDDNITGVRPPLTTPSVEEVAQVVWDIFGINWFGKKSFATSGLADQVTLNFKGVQYLGKYLRKAEYPVDEVTMNVVLPYRPFSETYLRLLFPEYGSLEPDQTWLRVLGNYIDAAGNPVTERWLQDLMDWLWPQVSEEPLTWPDNFQRMVSRDYSGIGVEVPKPERMSFDQWRDLVVLGKTDYKAYWKSDDETDQALYDPGE